MYNYQILVEKNIPQEVLTYNYGEMLDLGQLVKVTLRKEEVWGVVWSPAPQAAADLQEKTKTIVKITEIVFQKELLGLMKIFARNTFNSLNGIFKAYIQALKPILKARKNNFLDQKITIGKGFVDIFEKKSKGEIEYILDPDPLVRIRYIIRSYINTITDKPESNQEIRQILILLPEKKLLDFHYERLIGFQKENNLKNLTVLRYFPSKIAESKKTIESISSPNLQEQTKIQLILANRSGLFLPFSGLSEIWVVEESSPFYYQEQNSLYYDTRELVYLFNALLRVDLKFLSTFPSGRLNSFYSQSFSEADTSTHKPIKQKSLKTQISTRNKQVDEFELFSDFVESQIGEV